jgi:ubiquinone biosynthesis protein COQ9
MSQNLHSTTVAALDELYALIGLQELLDIALEQLQRADLAPEEKRARTVLLIISYLEQVKPCLENIEVELEEVRAFAPSLNNSLGGAA